jgi:multidrug efflux pump subunit AcrA (membrane-fusion protein)
LVFDNAEGRLRAGAFAEASITLGVAKNAILVPHEAVVAFAGVRKVFSVSDGVAHEHEIKTGLPHGALIEIVGYDGKDPVVVSGASKLVEGMAVDVQNAQAAQEEIAP